jgi:hypothetical protein
MTPFILLFGIGALVVVIGIAVSLKTYIGARRASLAGIRLQAAGMAIVTAAGAGLLGWFVLGNRGQPLAFVPAVLMAVLAIMFLVIAGRVRVQE